jgi:hypothetical protein
LKLPGNEATKADGLSRKRLELALRLREMYKRMLKREGASSQTA